MQAYVGSGDVARWIERALVALGLMLGLWWLLAAAQMHFYASLPVPTGAARVSELPGEEPASVVTGGREETTDHRVPPGEWVARLDAPSVGLAATIIQGSTSDMLARAAGHIEDTALPGEPGNVGIAGHRDTTFRAVRNLKAGDLLRLTSASGSYDYRVDRTLIVNPEDVYVLDPTDTPAVTLVTCYPFTFIGHAPKRFIVQATLVR
jgi:sortase A